MAKGRKHALWMNIESVMMEALADLVLTDCRPALLRVHLFGDHVLSVLLLRPRTCAWPHLDRRSSRICPVYISGHLVSVATHVFPPPLTNAREFCLRHPEVRDVCDIGQMLFFNSSIAWYATAVMFILNNTFIQVCSTFRGSP